MFEILLNHQWTLQTAIDSFVVERGIDSITDP